MEDVAARPAYKDLPRYKYKTFEWKQSSQQHPQFRFIVIKLRPGGFGIYIRLETTRLLV